MSRRVLVVDDEKLIVKGIRLVWSRMDMMWTVLMTEKRH